MLSLPLPEFQEHNTQSQQSSKLLLEERGWCSEVQIASYVSYKLGASSVHIAQYIMEQNVWSDVWNIFKYHWLQQRWAGCTKDPCRKLHHNTPHTYEAAVSHTRRRQLIHSFRSDGLEGTRNACIKKSPNSFKDKIR